MTNTNLPYRFFKNSRNNKLCILYPSAGGVKYKEEFIQLLIKDFNLLLVTDGYYGLSEIKEDGDIENKKFGKLKNAILPFLERRQFESYLFIGGSVGAIHLIDLCCNFKTDKHVSSVFISPAFYKRKRIAFWIYSKMLNYSLKNGNFLNKKQFEFIFKKLRFDQILSEMNRVINKVGDKSYLLCLKEIINLSEYVKNSLPLIEKSLTLIGKNDVYFNLLCDSELCKKSQLKIVNCRHSPMKENPEMTYMLINDYIRNEYEN